MKLIIFMMLLAVGVGIQVFYNFKNFEHPFVMISGFYTCALVAVLLVLSIQFVYEEKILYEKQIRKELVIKNSENLTLKEKEKIMEKNKDMHKIVFE